MRKLYGNFRNRLTDKQKGAISKIVFKLINKPTVRFDNVKAEKFPNGEKGGLIISADFEMAWAWRYTKTGADCILKGQQERRNFPNILNVLDQYKIPITFATVGHLFLDSCQSGIHDNMKRIPYFDDHWKFNVGDWFDHDPYTDYITNPEWYAPDLIKMILKSDVAHEIGTHTFTHIDFSYKNCPADVAKDELIACVQAAHQYGIKLKSIVFPGGTWGNIEVLKELGITIYRKNIEYDLSYPFRDKLGLLVSPTSAPIEFNTNYGWTMDYYVNRLKEHINKAIKTNTIAHFWFHPSLNPVFIEKIFPEIFEYASNLREKGSLWIGTMDTIADHINKNNIL